MVGGSYYFQNLPNLVRKSPLKAQNAQKISRASREKVEGGGGFIIFKKSPKNDSGGFIMGGGVLLLTPR